MIKNEYNKELTSKSNNNTNEIGSPKKNLRKDGKGNLILKKDSPIKKTKHHAHLIDNLIPGKDLANIVEVESYKKYNLDDEEQMEDDNNDIHPEEKIEENKVVVSHGCCLIF